MENPKQQLLERIKPANNVLVTVSANPSVDQLSAAIGLTLILNKMGKHATAVFSGSTPSTIEFLQPDKTLEKNTDSLRDFIIALDKTKADKLRYKVEDDHVKIFITPYRTSITEKDLDFSQGDFNVEVVVALGVTDPKDLDQAITAHGRILHDATTVSVTTGQQSSLGTINWAESNTSSLCEMVASLADNLQANVLDGQMATALMTGIVAETHRFSNEKTTPTTMSVSAKLMAAGANQQLVASNLQEGGSQATSVAAAPTEQATSDGSLNIDHQDVVDEQPFSEELPDVQPQDTDQEAHYNDDRVRLGDEPNNHDEQAAVHHDSAIEGGSSLILEPPTLGGQLTANSEPEHLDPSVDPLAGGSHNGPILTHDAPVDDTQPEPGVESEEDIVGTEELPGPSMTLPSESPQDQSVMPDVPETPAEVPAPTPFEPVMPDLQSSEVPSPTLTDLEQSVDSPHLDQQPVFPDTSAPELPIEQPAQTDELTAVGDAVDTIGAYTTPVPDADSARDAISAALDAANEPLPPIAALNAQPLDLEIKQTGQTGILDHIDEETGIPSFTMPENLVPSNTDLPADNTAAPNAAPPVPPPLMPGFDPSAILPPPPSDTPTQGDPGNPFNLPPA